MGAGGIVWSRLGDRAGACASRCLSARAGDAEKPAKPFTPGQVRFYETEVRPILKAHCLKCHGEGPKIRGGFRLDSRAAVLRGGDLGPAVSLREPEQSRLLKAIRYEELEMPPAGKLPAREIDVLTRWVKDGLPWTAESKAAASVPPTAAPPGEDSGAASAARRAGRFARSAARPVPVVKNRDWCRSPIDAFLLARLEAEGLEPAPPADRVTLIRRLTYDLTGLPPDSAKRSTRSSPTERPDAYERLVDRLLASPHYGEKWGRHWLDLVRYGETNGYERDSAKPFAWRYRDYVIAALNRDKPYDRFVREQLAGDEIDPASAEPLIATGFYRLGIWDDEPADRPLARYDGLDGIISTTGQVFLGMSINCARCHDHKVDPIPAARLLPAAGVLSRRHRPRRQEPEESRRSGPGSRIDVMCGRGARPGRHARPAPRQPAPAGRQGRAGRAARSRRAARPTFVSGPGKRRALAEWLTDRRNPRTARVLANRLWQYHFGRGIVPTPNDFGGLGEPPTHPELLDWLAAELMDGGWRLKRMHRLIVLSSAYRMSSRGSRGRAGSSTRPIAGSGGSRCAGSPPRKCATRSWRSAGTLNLKAGGPSVYPPIPREVLAGQSVPGQGWPTSPPGEAARRSVYVHVKRSLLVPILATHDAADTDSSCPVRYTTTVPTQALGLLNGAFANEQAAHFADRLRREAPGDLERQVRRAIRLTTAREPDRRRGPRRRRVPRRAWLGKGRLDPQTALTQYCLMMLNANAFLYLD